MLQAREFSPGTKRSREKLRVRRNKFTFPIISTSSGTNRVIQRCIDVSSLTCYVVAWRTFDIRVIDFQSTSMAERRDVEYLRGYKLILFRPMLSLPLSLSLRRSFFSIFPGLKDACMLFSNDLIDRATYSSRAHTCRRCRFYRCPCPCLGDS